MSPHIFKDINDQSAVVRDPASENESYQAYQALYSCPTNSIGVITQDVIAKAVVEDFPFEIENGVYCTGFHSEKSYGATSYFIKRANGNILIDSPRFLKKLALKFEQLGGIKYQLLTHQDDVADTDLYHEQFKSTRLIHQADTNSKTKKYETIIQGEADIQLDQDLTIIPTPGHTEGSICFLYQKKYLFTGDHLCFSPSKKHLIGFKDANWYSLSTQIKSLQKLLQYDFEYLLPGHGAPIKLSSDEMKISLQKCIDYMMHWIFVAKE